MRYVSQLFQPLITIPKGAKIKNTEITCKSQKLLVECGLVRPTGSGLLALLPLARRALDKLESLVISCLEEAGAQRLSLPGLTPARLWQASGRLDDVGAELLKVEDRHGKKYLLAPTHEEAISELLADVGPVSHKQLPLILYQITNKYRDEFRPKHGLLRAREFSMMDAYSVHPTEQCAQRTYQRLSDAYSKLFARLQLPVHRVVAPSGDMGGSLSHEWQLAARAGEDQLALCPSCSHAALAPPPAPAPAPPPAPAACPRCGAPTDTRNSIEVGHTFVLGSRYSAPLRALCAPPAGAPAPLHMACYGIGVTRLLAAALEALSTDAALRWPRALAPYTVMLIGPKEGSREWAAGARGAAEALGGALAAAVGGDLLVDDRHALTVGKRLLHADRMGYPHVVVCGRSSLESPPRYELHSAGAGGERGARAEPGDRGAPALLTAAELLRAVTDRREDHENKAVAYYTWFHFKFLRDSSTARNTILYEFLA